MRFSVTAPSKRNAFAGDGVGVTSFSVALDRGFAVEGQRVNAGAQRQFGVDYLVPGDNLA